VVVCGILAQQVHGIGGRKAGNSQGYQKNDDGRPGEGRPSSLQKEEGLPPAAAVNGMLDTRNQVVRRRRFLGNRGHDQAVQFVLLLQPSAACGAGIQVESQVALSGGVEAFRNLRG